MDEDWRIFLKLSGGKGLGKLQGRKEERLKDDIFLNFLTGIVREATLIETAKFGQVP